MEELPRTKVLKERKARNRGKITTNHHQGDLRQRIGPQHSSGFQPQTGRSEQWTVDPFWEIDRPTPAQHQQDLPGPPSATTGANTMPPCQ